ncbi:hypothetical protein BKG91_03470 [Rodentibacter caecimuris]|uniref:LexA family transcriptional regulator n=1 Tax=Rodentibacter caecimuris TaxID=1796644 RepID=UPI000750A532|nr:S24 family peptidase [Rodentibacter heylii]AOF53697.1 Phage repressor [Pasteurellaceae bacterium NI1060]OOF75515.1 hypothetical protein BKG91_03470 [Rodentibacter heylii]
MGTLATRLNKLLKEKDINQTEFAEMVGIKQPSMQRILSGETKNPRKIIKMASVLGVDPNWLLYGDRGAINIGGNAENSPITTTTNNFFSSDKLAKDELRSQREKQKTGLEHSTVNNLPIHQGVINDDFHNLFESLVFSDDGLIEIAKLRNTNGISMITMFNDSMQPAINKGDIVLVNTTLDKYSGEGVYLFIMNNEVYVRRLFQSPDGILRAKAMNEDAGSSFDIAENNLVRVTFLGKCIRVIEMKSHDL